MDFDYPFANLPSALVETLPRVFLLLSYFNLSLSGWTSRVAAHILEGPWLTTRGASRASRRFRFAPSPRCLYGILCGFAVLDSQP